MKTSTYFTLSVLALVPNTLAQCTAPVPCEDESLNALNTTDCQSYHAFIARGSDSGYPGHLGPLAKLTCSYLTDKIPSATCGYENIIYPANSSWSGSDSIWCESAAIGAKNGQQQMKEYAERCPDAKLILLGYSQGASVALDILGGGGGDVFKCTQADNPAMDPKKSPGSHIVAAAVFGAVHRSAHQPYTFPNGGQDHNGTNSRNTTQLTALSAFEPILREYCNIGDPICAPDSEDQSVDNHLNYFEKYNENAATFIVERVMNSTTTNSTRNGTASSGSKGDSDDTSNNVQSGDNKDNGEKGAAAVLSATGGALGWCTVFGVAMMLLL